jgi:cell division protease FtsH
MKPSPTKTGKDKPSKKTDFEPAGKKTPWRLSLSALEKGREEELKRQFTVVPLQDPKLNELLQSHGVDFKKKEASNWFLNAILNWVLPFAILFFLWGYIMKKMGRGPGILSVGKSKAKLYEVDSSNQVTFADVAGIDEAVEEVREIVDFLKNPDKYTRLGAKLPKGILLVGPPGTGKTLLARAVAGEAKAPFFSMTGSDFVEMFVGVGAARVRDLFTEAKKTAPCIIFIDELDAVGKSRGGTAPIAGGYDERENTLNQLLTEMDGFDTSLGIIIMGASNRPDVLDPALLRPGRFDRQILVDRPDLRGRLAIFRIHVRALLLAQDVHLNTLAGMTPGFAGAEIANVCNEAALLANRKGHETVWMADFEEAVERVIGGLEKKNKLINQHEREVVSYHESGHAIVGHFTPGADPVRKVSIVPRGLGALGYTLQSPLEDRYLMSRQELIGRVKGLLGGRAAEEVAFGEISTGAADDLEKATRIIWNMLTVYGMSRSLPNLSLVERNDGQYLGQSTRNRPYSDKVEQLIDEESQEILNQCYQEDIALLRNKRNELERTAKLLLSRETLDEADIKDILGPRPLPSTTEVESTALPA